jgi:1-acyl-sn-glycerol-3-phosphate acyltransferase
VYKQLNTLLSAIWLAYALLVFFSVMLLVLPFILLAFATLGEKHGGQVAYIFLKVWGRSFILFGIHFSVKGRENIPTNVAAVFVCNHSSYLDAPAISVAVPGQFRPLGKIELSRSIFFGWIYRKVVVMVDRSNVQSRAESIKQMAKKLSQGIPILVFPEGTMNRTDELLQPFQPGAFKLALQTGAPIVPMVIYNSRKLLPPGQYLKLRPGVIKVEFAKSINSRDFTEPMALSKAAENVMRAIIQEMKNSN